MEKITINTENAPQAIGPYAQAIRCGNLIFTSGQIPLDPKTGEMVEGDIEVHIRRAFDNVKEILDAAGSSLANVLKATIYVTDLENFVAVNELFSLYFNKSKPARAVVEVSRLPKDALIEIEVVAIAP
ncbi:MAG: RidA family protein [Pseudomonadota bacterium]